MSLEVLIYFAFILLMIWVWVKNEPVELKPTILTMVRMCLKAKISYRFT